MERFPAFPSSHERPRSHHSTVSHALIGRVSLPW
jgi:hypothetical protein